MIQIYHQRKYQIVKEINTINELKEFIFVDKYFPEVLDFRQIEKYLFDHAKARKLIDNQTKISLNKVKSSIINQIIITRKIKLEHKLTHFYRGYSYEDCQKLENTKCGYTNIHRQSWIQRGFRPKQADKKSRAYFDNLNLRETLPVSSYSKEYWLIRGYTEEEAIEKISKIQTVNAKKSANRPIEEKRKASKWCKEYWLIRGYTEEEAIEKISKIQDTNSLERYIRVYGKHKGPIKFRERQEKWLKTLYDKSPEEIIEFHKSQGKTRNELIEKWGEKRAEEIIKSRCNGLGGCSNESYTRVLNDLIDLIKINTNINCEELYHGKGVNKEYSLYNKNKKKLYFYDFTIPKKRIILEYHGETFHPNPKMNDEEFKKWKQPFSNLPADICLSKDLTKQSYAEQQGFNVFVIYSSFTNEEISDIIDQIITLCKE
jgi:very-short-patch-repair endonuclease